MNQKYSRLNLFLALCPAIAAASTAWAGLALGVVSLVIALLSCLFRRLADKILPARARLLAGLVFAAALTAVAGLLMEAYLPEMYAPLRELFPLLAVQSILLSLVFAKDGKALHSPLVWLGYLVVIFVIGALREFLGAGSLFGCQILGEGFDPIAAVAGAPGAFLGLAFLGMIVNALRPAGKEDEA